MGWWPRGGDPSAPRTRTSCDGGRLLVSFRERAGEAGGLQVVPPEPGHTANGTGR